MKNSEGNALPVTEKSYRTHDHKKPTAFKSPDIKQLKEVIIDSKTRIYIPIDASSEAARSRYFENLETKGKALIASRKPVANS